MGLLDKIKRDVKSSGGSKNKFMYWRDGDKQRIRFLQDMDEGLDITFFDSFEKNINLPDQRLFGRNMAKYENMGLRERSQYIWSVWDYEAKEVRLFMFPVNNYTPIPAIMAMYENYGTLLDRDYVISQTGKGTSKAFSVIPMDKNKFRNTKAKPYSKQKVLELLDKAWPAENVEGEENSFDVNESDYQDQSPVELYKLCIEKGIDVEPRKPKAFYINQLEEFDSAQDDWGASDDELETTNEDDVWDEEEDEIEEDWEDAKPDDIVGIVPDEVDPEKEKEIATLTPRTPVELYKLAKAQGLDVEPRQDAAYYIDRIVEDKFPSETKVDDLDEWDEDLDEWSDDEWE